MNSQEPWCRNTCKSRSTNAIFCPDLALCNPINTHSFYNVFSGQILLWQPGLSLVILSEEFGKKTTWAEIQDHFSLGVAETLVQVQS